ncbi:MAG TPA: hypothetical protein VGF73_08875 [Chthoniobacterales bacterium]
MPDARRPRFTLTKSRNHPAREKNFDARLTKSRPQPLLRLEQADFA